MSTFHNRTVRKALPALANAKASGYFLIELGLALVISTILLAAQVAKMNDAVEESLASGTGQYLVALQAGLNLYQITNEAALSNASPVVTGFANPLKPTTAELITNHYLPTGFGSVSPLGLSFVHEFKQIGTCPGTTCLITGLSYSTAGYKDVGGIVRNDVLSVAVAKIGADGSQSFAGSGGTMTGYAGAYSHPASDFGTVEGTLAIRIGDNSGINGLLNQFYKLDGSRPLAGQMNANNNNIVNIKDLSSTGTATLNDAVVNGTLLLTGTATPGTACVASETSKIKKNTSGDGLVICNAGLWQRVGDAVNGITPGGVCSVNNLLGTDAQGVAYICNGSFWTSLSNFANPGDSCSPSGKVATSSSTNEQLICKNGAYMKLNSLLTKNVQVGPHFSVIDGTVVTKPVCDTGGAPNYSLVLTQSAVDVSTAPPYQSTYVSAQNNGPSWTVLLKLKKSAIDGGGEVSASAYGLSAVMTLECTY